MTIHRFAPSLLFVCLCSAANAEWIQRHAYVEPSNQPGIVHQHVVLENGSAEAILDLARFSPGSTRLRLIQNADGNRDLASVMRTDDCVAGVNGGYFDENFAPLGLRISDGKMLAPLVRARLLSGLFSFSDAQVRILRVSEFSKRDRPSVGLQAGPFLVDHGRGVKGLNSTRPARRTFVAVSRSNQVTLGCSSEVSLAELSEILSTHTDELNNESVLNLDGGSSTAFWFKRKDGTTLSISEQKPVRDFIGVVPR